MTSTDDPLVFDGNETEASQLHRGLRILRLLADGPKSAATIARMLGVHRSTASRLLRELESTRYVTRGSDRRYVVQAERMRALVPLADDQSDWTTLVNPILAGLRDHYQEAANFSVPVEGSMVYMSYFPSPQVVAIREGTGSVRPMYCSAIGKAYLSSLDEAELASVLSSLTYTGGTERAASGALELRDQLEATRSRGYAFDLQESLKGVVCVATGVRLGGDIVGASGITAPFERMSEDAIRAAGEHLLAVFTELARQTEPGVGNV